MYTLYKSREDIAVILPFVDELEVALMGEVGSADVDADVGNARD